MRGFAVAQLGAVGHKIAAWPGEESRRLFDWIPVGLALGIALYFSLSFEPDIRVGLVAVCAFALLAWVVRHWGLPRLLFLSLLMIALGFASAGWRSLRVAAPQLEFQNLVRHVDATVEQVSNSADKPLKLLLLNPVIAGLEPARTPHRLSITIRTKTTDLAPGDRVGLRAVMMPPGAPAMPGAFDYARQSYFQGIGAVGFAASPVTRLTGPPKSAPSWGEGFDHDLEKLRRQITEKFITGIEGEDGGLAAAMVTDVRDGIPADVVLAMRNAGLSHLVAVSGLQMGLVTGIMFFFVRALLAAIPALALNYPIKKWAAVVAGLVALAYLLISGAGLPMIRAYAMGSLVFIAVIFDRNPISMRLLALAAIIIFIFKPESLLNVSFQLSFAAVGALIATYDWLQGPIGRWKIENPGLIFRIMLYPVLLSLTSVAATLATAPITIYHFNQIAAYGVISNMLAIPLVGFWITPLSIVAVVLMPFHLEGLVMAPLGYGVKLLIMIAREVSSWPDASLSVPGFSVQAYGVIVFGGAWLCLWRSPIRLAGLAIMGAGVMMALSQSMPDILIDGQGKLMAVKGENGQYLVSNLRSDKYAREFWLRSNGQSVAEKWPVPAKARTSKSRKTPSPLMPATFTPVPISHDQSLSCDANQCLYAPWKNRPGESLVVNPPQIILHFGKEPLAAAYRQAALIVSTNEVAEPVSGNSLLIDRYNSYYNGSHAIWISQRQDNQWQFKIMSAADARGVRPWSGSREAPPWLEERSHRAAYTGNNF